MSDKKPMRERMPETAAFIDAMRAAFGAECIDEQIRNGMHGLPTFHAVENGHEVGTAFDAPAVMVSLTDMVLPKREGKT